MAKKTFRMSARIIGCNQVFQVGFEPGVFVTQDLVYDLPEERYQTSIFVAELMDRKREFLEENVEALIEEVK